MTLFKDNQTNRKKLALIIQQMQAEMTLGTFDYRVYFPKSDKAAEMAALNNRVKACRSNVPLFSEFVDLWFEEKQIEWRLSYQQKITIMLKNYCLPRFDSQSIDSITKADLLSFRNFLGKVTYGKAQKTLSASRINQIMTLMRMILDEASERYHFDNPFKGIKQLKEEKPEIFPFSLEEVWQFINNVRADYRNYYIVRFFTGLRTSEIDGLRWDAIDFHRREIRVHQALVNGALGPTKTRDSNRDVEMSQLVFDTLKAQETITRAHSDYVFCNNQGNPFTYRNVNRRVWHPTLAFLGLEKRKAYQTRHTCATLWLASGENPEWVAKQLGHANTEMLFRVYSRYVPNLTRKDGSAFEALLNHSQLTHRQNESSTDLTI